MPEHADVRARYTMPIEVQPQDIDALGHVNNVVYVRWIQDVAVAHWRSFATPEEQAAVLWVVARHEIDYKRPARPGDHLVAETWIGVSKRTAFDRHTEILRAGDRKVLVRARTVWCPIEPATGRPQPVSDDLRARWSVAEEYLRARRGRIE